MPLESLLSFCSSLRVRLAQCKKGNDRISPHKIAVFEPYEFIETFVPVNGIIVGNNAFGIGRGLNSTLTTVM